MVRGVLCFEQHFQHLLRVYRVLLSADSGSLPALLCVLLGVDSGHFSCVLGAWHC